MGSVYYIQQLELKVKTRKMLGFEPKYDLAKGLKATFHYFLDSYKDNSV
jgi:nucleoside-diphosphate-sugar epimerase